MPNPKDTLQKIQARGVRVCVWINPFIAQESRLFSEADTRGFFLKRCNGSTYQTDDWQAGMAIVDFTNTRAVEWWQGHLEQLLDMGVDTFKTDFGEKIPVEDVIFSDGSDPLSMHNHL